MHSATYSPEDNKLRIYPAHRLSADEYARVKAHGFKWAPQQELFVAPMWTPERADLAEEMAGEIGDEDTSLCERAEERAERFGEYQENRTSDAESARRAVSAIADNIPLGQPILVGHHSERHARRDAEKIENGMRRAVKMWETAKYWQSRAAGALRNAKYKERPDVRARRIKGLEADLRKFEKAQKKNAAELHLFDLIDQPEKWKPREDGATLDRMGRARYVSGLVYAYAARSDDGRTWTAYDVLRPDGERYKDCPEMSIDAVIAAVRESFARMTANNARWIQHLENRLSYERAMLADGGGTVADRTGPEKGGAVRCWASPGYGKGWSYIQKVNKVSVSVLDNWGNGGGNFPRTIPFDKLIEIMPAATLADLRSAGRIAETADKTGFYVRPEGDGESRAPTRDEARFIAHNDAVQAQKAEAAPFAAMKETLRAGVQVVTAPQLFPTPPDLAARMVEIAEIHEGARVLEPSAGTGAILKAIGPQPDKVAVEINPELVKQLARGGAGSGARIIAADFLQCNGDLGKFDRIIMNPPFENGADIRHIQHARGFLKPGGRLVALCANGPRQRAALQPIADSWEDLPPGTFASQGTGVNVALLVIEAA